MSDVYFLPDGSMQQTDSDLTLPLIPGGVTLRDWLAGLAMQGYIAATSEDEKGIYGYSGIAEEAYAYADALLEARKAKE